MATIKIDRTSEWMNRMRSYRIYIDNVEVGTVKNGGSASFELPSGIHTIYTKIDWCYSPTVSFMVGETGTKQFAVGAFKGAKWVSPLIIVYVVLYSIFKTKEQVDYLMYLGIPLLLIIFYFITFGRKKYLSLTEESAYKPQDRF